MSFAEFLSKNWSQITVVLTALGAVIKIIFDFQIRKKEIKFEYLFKEKASSFQDFMICLQNFKTQLIKEAYIHKYGSSTFSEFETTMDKSRKELESKINLLLIYCSHKEKESLYAILNSCTFVLHAIKNVNVNDIEKVLQDNCKKNDAIINKLIKNFHL